MTLRQKILLLGLFAICGLAFALWLQYRHYADQVRAMAAVKRNIDAVATLSLATHALQKERGLAAIGDPTGPDGTLQRQFQDSDAALARLAAAGIATADVRAALERQRAAMRAGAMAPLAARDAYTNLLRGLIDEMDRLTREPEAAVAKADISAHAHLISAKEYLGQIRATLGHWIERGGDARLALQNVVRLKGGHDEELRKFALQASPELRDFLDAQFADEDVRKMQRTLARLLAGGSLPPELGASAWFALATAAMDRLKSVEDKSLQLIERKAEDGLAELRRAMRAGVLVTLALGAAVLVLALSATVSLLRALDRALSSIELISESKDFSNRIPADSPDEIGRISRSFNELLEIAERLLREKEYLANTDMLTGANNRLRFAQVLREEAERKRRSATPMALVIFDIDHFKRINDTHGHNAGDEVLRSLAKLVDGQIRSTDFFGRWGGEEFVLLLRDNDCDAAMLLAEKVRCSIEAADFPAVGKVTCSFGVAAWEEGDSETGFVARADRALYESKRRGRNQARCERSDVAGCGGRDACAASAREAAA